jgi:transketolase
MRPCDTVEAAACWTIALKATQTPSLMALSRQNLPTLAGGKAKDALRGGYIIAGDANRKVTLIATGSEVSIAVEAHEKLKAAGISSAVVSMPCMEVFAAQDEGYRKQVLGEAPRIVVEAAIRMPWDKYLREQDGFIGMNSFGESAPAPELYKHFGITAEAVFEAAKQRA